jgi:Excalibur calcium-binding domain
MKLLAAAAAAASVAVALSMAPPADAAARHFKSCTAMNKVYPHGVGLWGAHDHTSGTRVTNFKRNNALYRANNGPRNQSTGEYDLDRDNDHIACEKR